jgi:hypothetical protein
MQHSNILKINRDFADSNLASDSSSLELRLEKGDLIYPSWSLDSIFNSDELKVLCSYKPKGLWHQTISFHPNNGMLVGSNSKELETLLGRVSKVLIDKMQVLLPKYDGAIRLDRVVLNNVEAATSGGKNIAKDDLLHLDTLRGGLPGETRVVKLSCNINFTNTRIWEKGPSLASLLADSRSRAELTSQRKSGFYNDHSGNNIAAILEKIGVILRQSEVIQKKIPRKVVVFPAHSFWLAMTDVCLHSTLRGSNVLEFMFFVQDQALCSGDLSAPCLLQSFFASAIKQAAA